MTDTTNTQPEISAEQAQMIEYIERLGALLTGRARPSARETTRDILCETDAFVATILDPDYGWVSEHSMVFVPDESGNDSDIDQVVVYEGNMAMGGDELSLAGMFRIQFQEYSISPYVPVLGATLIRIASADDVQAFFEDADAALRTGEFSDVITNPLVELADQCALGADVECSGLNSLYVSADGQVSAAADGLALGYVTDGFAAIEEAYYTSGHSCQALHLGAAVDEAELREAIDARPWLAGYLQALSSLKILRSQDKTQLRVSGFGGRLAPGLDDRPFEPGEPVIVYDRDRAYVFGTSGQHYGLGLEAAVCLEALQLTGDRAAAIAAVAEYSSTTPETIDAQISPVLDSLIARGLVTTDVSA